MNVRKLRPLAAALGMWAGGHAAAQTPAPVNNKALADTVAARLAALPAVLGADVAVTADGGVISVTGTALGPAQKQAILSEVRVVPGVTLVRDGVAVGGGIMQADGTLPQPMPLTSGPVGLPPGGPMVSAHPTAYPPGAAPGYAGPVVEPVPLGPGGAGTADGFAPPLPPYAWPTYAPYNNVSRVGYPTAYPYNAFPFIGPFYPFPKVPLGWRSVTLTWEDGHWWMGKTAMPHDYWRARFW